jgi:hypothetical protein
MKESIQKLNLEDGGYVQIQRRKEELFSTFAEE